MTAARQLHLFHGNDYDEFANLRTWIARRLLDAAPDRRGLSGESARRRFVVVSLVVVDEIARRHVGPKLGKLIGGVTYNSDVTSQFFS
jgi:hypothetical protein